MASNCSNNLFIVPAVVRCHVHLRTITRRALRAEAKIPWRPHAGEAQGNQGGDATADAPANPRTGQMSVRGPRKTSPDGWRDDRLKRLSDLGDQLETFRWAVDFELFWPELNAALAGIEASASHADDMLRRGIDIRYDI
jgi:hypothetical protein